VKKNEPITGEQIAEYLKVSRGTIRPDLAILTMSGILEAKTKVGYFYHGKSIENTLNEIFSITVDEIKSVPVVVDEETSVYDAAVMMFLEDVGTIFVVKNNYLKGVISRKDLLKATLSGNSSSTIPVSVVMTRLSKIVYCSKNDIFIDAVRKIVDYHIDCLPIVSEDAPDKLRVIGRISKTNISKYILEIGRLRKE
jgi:CBS domain-containing protein